MHYSISLSNKEIYFYKIVANCKKNSYDIVILENTKVDNHLTHISSWSIIAQFDAIKIMGKNLEVFYMEGVKINAPFS